MFYISRVFRFFFIENQSFDLNLCAIMLVLSCFVKIVGNWKPNHKEKSESKIICLKMF